MLDPDLYPEMLKAMESCLVGVTNRRRPTAEVHQEVINHLGNTQITERPSSEVIEKVAMSHPDFSVEDDGTTKYITLVKPVP